MASSAGTEGTSPSVEAAYDVVVVGSSAGGLNALIHVLGPLPATLPAAVLIVQHLDPRYLSMLPEILQKSTSLKTKQPRDGDPIIPGWVYLAPPDNHMLVHTKGILSLSHAAEVKYVRPSIDLLFASAAETYGKRCLGVVLTGRGSDGSMGVRAIDRAGGTVIVQSQESSAYKDMPCAAIATGAADYILSLDDISLKIIHLLKPGEYS